LELHAAGVLAALAAAVFGAQSAHGRAPAALLAATFAGAVFGFARLGELETRTLGFCIVAAAVAGLVRPRWWLLPPVAGGLCAAAWVSILQSQGLPWLPALVAAGCLLAAAAALAARRRGFLPAELRDEALVLVAAFALLASLGPAVVEGWRAAVALKAEPLAAAGPDVGPWLGALVVASVLLGGAYTMWKRR
jgi:hypothetical protein